MNAVGLSNVKTVGSEVILGSRERLDNVTTLAADLERVNGVALLGQRCIALLHIKNVAAVLESTTKLGCVDGELKGKVAISGRRGTRNSVAREAGASGRIGDGASLVLEDKGVSERAEDRRRLGDRTSVGVTAASSVVGERLAAGHTIVHTNRKVEDLDLRIVADQIAAGIAPGTGGVRGGNAVVLVDANAGRLFTIAVKSAVHLAAVVRVQVVVVAGRDVVAQAQHAVVTVDRDHGDIEAILEAVEAVTEVVGA